MNVKEIVRTVTGSIVVYAIVASCSPSIGGGPSAELGTGGNGAATPGSGAMMAMQDASASSAARSSSGSAGKLMLDAALDHMTHPVPDARADPNQNGSRLRGKYLVGQDGSKQFFGWHDTLRDEDCNFSLASDGVEHCLPSASYGTYFADTGCTKPVAAVPIGTCGASPPAPKFIATANACSTSGPSLWTDVSMTTGAVYAGNPASCTKLASALTGYVLFAAATKVDPALFVAATAMIE